jgi:hypothetical protein
VDEFDVECRSTTVVHRTRKQGPIAVSMRNVVRFQPIWTESCLDQFIPYLKPDANPYSFRSVFSSLIPSCDHALHSGVYKCLLPSQQRHVYLAPIVTPISQSLYCRNRTCPRPVLILPLETFEYIAFVYDFLNPGLNPSLNLLLSIQFYLRRSALLKPRTISVAVLLFTGESVVTAMFPMKR